MPIPRRSQPPSTEPASLLDRCGRTSGNLGHARSSSVWVDRDGARALADQVNLSDADPAAFTATIHGAERAFSTGADAPAAT
jgi:hypothetical protein